MERDPTQSGSGAQDINTNHPKERAHGAFIPHTLRKHSRTGVEVVQVGVNALKLLIASMHKEAVDRSQASQPGPITLHRPFAPSSYVERMCYL